MREERPAEYDCDRVEMSIREGSNPERAPDTEALLSNLSKSRSMSCVLEEFAERSPLSIEVNPETEDLPSLQLLCMRVLLSSPLDDFGGPFPFPWLIRELDDEYDTKKSADRMELEVSIGFFCLSRC
jgi:hypothetical protein